MHVVEKSMEKLTVEHFWPVATAQQIWDKCHAFPVVPIRNISLTSCYQSRLFGAQLRLHVQRCARGRFLLQGSGDLDEKGMEY